MPQSQIKIIVVLPTYNEKENLQNMVEALFALQIPNFSLVVVDDNSPDGTGQIADDLSQQAPYQNRIDVVHRAQKEGLGPAYKQGIKRALELGADYVIQMDCDFSHQPKYIPEMIKLAPNYDMVIGSRYIKGGSVDENWGPIRKLLSWFANRVYTAAILGMSIHDATGGFRMYQRHAIIGLDLDRIKSSGYVFQVELAYVAHKLGYRMAEIAIHFPDRQIGTSKMTSSIAMEAALRVWQIRFRHHSLTDKFRRTTAYS